MCIVGVVVGHLVSQLMSHDFKAIKIKVIIKRNFSDPITITIHTNNDYIFNHYCRINISEKENIIDTQQPNTVYNSDNCPICLEIMTKPQILSCGHVFHLHCISQCLSPLCPLCRKKFNKKL